ncbi:MAG: hypothetical protein K2O01_04285 [Bacteroidales bacterium]|nr:hypothetical protein [Bacteroidales bacterium]
MESVFQFWQNVTRKTKSLMPLQVFAAQVEEVDEKKRTCRVKINDGVSFEDVRLYGLTDEGLKGFCLIPKQDSMVLVSRIDNGNELYVTMFSEVDKVLGTIGDKTEVAIEEQSLSYKCDKTEITVKSAEVAAKIDGVKMEVKDNEIRVKAKKITFNDGANDGLVKINDLTAKINDFVDAFNNHTHEIPSIKTTVTGNTSNAVLGLPSTVTGSGTVSNVTVPPISETENANKLDAKSYKDENVIH